jgi:hypothetical protein
MSSQFSPNARASPNKNLPRDGTIPLLEMSVLLLRTGRVKEA